MVREFKRGHYSLTNFILTYTQDQPALAGIMKVPSEQRPRVQRRVSVTPSRPPPPPFWMESQVWESPSCYTGTKPRIQKRPVSVVSSYGSFEKRVPSDCVGTAPFSKGHVKIGISVQMLSAARTRNAKPGLRHAAGGDLPAGGGAGCGPRCARPSAIPCVSSSPAASPHGGGMVALPAGPHGSWKDRVILSVIWPKY